MGKLVYVLLVVFSAYVIYKWFIEEEEFNFDELSGKRILVTGASSGIGEAIALLCARYGASVVITARRKELLEQVARRCEEVSPNNAKVSIVTADMSDMKQVKMLVLEAITLLGGGIDLLFLNHGLVPEWNDWLGTEENLTLHDRIIDVNYRSHVHLASHALPYLMKSNASIGIVGSLAGRVPTTRSMQYSASKFAQDSFFSGLSMEFKIRRINVSATYCVIGIVDNERASGVFKRYAQNHDCHLGRLYWLLPPADLTLTVRAIVSATARRKRDLYYPPNQYIHLMYIVRAAWPDLTDMIYSIFRKQPGEIEDVII